MRAAALQFDVRRGDLAANLREVERGVEQAVERQVELLVLPEMWPTSFPDAGADMAAEQAAARAAVARLAELASAHGLMVCGTAFGHDEPAERPPNRWQLFDGARELARYDKVHLFSPTAEPEVFTAGRARPPTVATRLGRIAGLVCYDLRFPELTREPWRDGAELLCVPAQWPVARAAHLDALCAGLAVANQGFVVAANRTGTETVGRRGLVLDFPGNSRIVDPHGRTLAQGDGRAGLVVADCDLALCAELRKRVPVARDLRDDLYSTWRR